MVKIFLRKIGVTPIFAIFILALLGLPFALIYTVKNQMQAESLESARAISELMLQVRRYYNLNIVNRLNKANEAVVVSENYHDIDGAIPLPATMSIEIARLLTQNIPNSPFDFNFSSDYPFKGRNRPALDQFQREALKTFRSKPELSEYWRQERSATGAEVLRLAIPVKMQSVCISCHNSHPDSTYRFWKVGDVRGIQDVTVRHSVSQGRIDNFIFLGIYIAFFVSTLGAAILEYRRNNRKLLKLNEEHEHTLRLLEIQSEKLRLQVDDLITKTEVLDKAPFGVLLADPNKVDMPVVYVNDAFIKITGYARNEVLGKNCRFLQGPDTERLALDNIRDSIKERRSIDIEIVNYRRNGEKFHNRLMLFPCFNNDGVLINWVGCVYDVTEFNNATEEKNRLASELQESLKLESLGLTIAGIAHDLNTPIGISLTASSHLAKIVSKMKDSASADNVSGDLIKGWSESIDRASQLIINNLGKAAGLVRSFKQTTADATRVEWRKIAVKNFLESLVTAVSPLMRRAQCQVDILCPESLSLRTEPGYLSQVITNLLVNASLHAFEGVDERVISIRVSEDESKVVIEVSDNGNGMSDEAIAKAFTPFFTTRRGQGGSGLGLFSARRVVESTLGGKLTFRSEKGKGATFIIFLPNGGGGLG